jgi:hypothetical protein
LANFSLLLSVRTLLCLPKSRFGVFGPPAARSGERPADEGEGGPVLEEARKGRDVAGFDGIGVDGVERERVDKSCNGSMWQSAVARAYRSA